jgi:hypothetical protein
VTNACRVLKLGIPELISAVDRAEIAVSKAALIAQFTKEQQAKILALPPQEADKATKALILERKQAAVAAATGAPPFDARAWGDQRLLETFKCLGARLTKPGRNFQLELTRNWQDELCKAVAQRENFVRLIRSGVLIVTKDDVA